MILRDGCVLPAQTHPSLKVTREQGGSEDGQVAVPLERGDLRAVLLPLPALVAQEEVEDVLAERLRDELAALHGGDGLAEGLRQRRDAQRTTLALGEGPDV